MSFKGHLFLPILKIIMKLHIANNGATNAATQLGQHAFDAKLADTILSEFRPQRPALNVFSALPELPDCWKPFYSSLIDTVRVVLNIQHAPLDRFTEHNVNIRRDGFTYKVCSPNTLAVAHVFSRNKCSRLIIEFSAAKYLTGQNLVGRENVHESCLQGIKAVLNAMKLMPTLVERKAIELGAYRLTRVDLTSHVDCGTVDRAAAMMIALRDLLVGKGKDIGIYDQNTFYIGQHSHRRSFKFYRKDLELQKNPMSFNVYGRDALMRKAVGLVRLELVLRREELIDLGLDNPLAWTVETGHALVNRWVDHLKLAEGCVPDVALVDQLTPVLQQKFRAWLYGDEIAFSRGVTQETYRDSRSRVLTTTGIDVDNHLSPEQQRDAMLTIREMFDKGFGFRSWDSKWPDLVAAHAKRKTKINTKKA
jgi:hypothetical protein